MQGGEKRAQARLGAMVRNKREFVGIRARVLSVAIAGAVLLLVHGQGALKRTSTTRATKLHMHTNIGCNRQLLAQQAEGCSLDGFDTYAKGGPAVVVYLLGITYMAACIAISADSFFIPVLSIISEELQLSEDVAGATFMAMGSSAPELFSAGLSLFQEKVTGSSSSELGVGTIVGSSVFNIVAIIGASCLACKSSFTLDWRAQIRDGFFYCASVLGIYFAFRDGQVFWWEGLCLFLSYIVYVLWMWKNELLLNLIDSCYHRLFYVSDKTKSSVSPQNWGDIERGETMNDSHDGFDSATAQSLMDNARKNSTDSGAGMSDAGSDAASDSGKKQSLIKKRKSIRTRWRYAKELVLQQLRTECKGHQPKLENIQEAEVMDFPAEHDTDADDGNGETPRLRRRMASIAMQVTYTRRKEGYAPCESNMSNQVLSFGNIRQIRRYMRQWQKQYANWEGNAANIRESTNFEKDSFDGSDRHGDMRLSAATDNFQEDVESTNNVQEKAEPEEDALAPLKPPEGGHWYEYISYALMLPPNFFFVFTTPPCWLARWRYLYPLAFLVCVFWVGFLSYFLVEWATSIACILDIPPVIVGTVLTAAATSVPDLIASVQVAKAEMPDMATANAVGSNTFDLLCGIGLPYFLILLAADGVDGKIDVDTSRLGPSLIVLLGVAMLYYIPLALAQWRLGPKLGIFLLGVYVLFLALQIIEWQVGLYERDGR